MKRFFPLPLIVLGVLLSVAAFGQIVRSDRKLISKTDILPAQIAGLDLTSAKSGESAISEFTSMHGREFPVISADIGYYGDGAITLWVAGTSTDSIATEMVDSMQARIAEGNSAFTPVNEIQNGHRTVYALDGMGQKHYYFQSNQLVIWLAAPPSLAADALQQILEVYR